MKICLRERYIADVCVPGQGHSWAYWLMSAASNQATKSKSKSNITVSQESRVHRTQWPLQLQVGASPHHKLGLPLQKLASHFSYWLFSRFISLALSYFFSQLGQSRQASANFGCIPRTSTPRPPSRSASRAMPNLSRLLSNYTTASDLV